MAKTVKVGKLYKYHPVGWDVFDSKVKGAGVVDGDILKVVNMPGCPKANTMGHCHVEKDGQFVGLVMCASLTPVED